MPQAAARLSQQIAETPPMYAPPIVAPPPAGTVRIVVQPFVMNGGGRSGGGPPPGSTPPNGSASSGAPATGNSGNPRRQASRLGFAIADSLRAGLQSHSSVDVVDAELTGKALGNNSFNFGGNTNGGTYSNNFVSVGFALRANYVVTGTLEVRRDSIIVYTQFNDLRGGFSRTVTNTVPLADVYSMLPATLTSLNMWIDSARVARRPDRGQGRGGIGRVLEDGGPSATDNRNRNGRSTDGSRSGALTIEVPRAPKVPPSDDGN